MCSAVCELVGLRLVFQVKLWRRSMLHDGLYELLYKPAAAARQQGFDSLLVSLREGQVLGSDRWGGFLYGGCVRDARSGCYHIKARFRIPPGGTLVTDHADRPGGGLIDVSTMLQPLQASSGVCSAVDVAGQQLLFLLHFRCAQPA